MTLRPLEVLKLMRPEQWYKNLLVFLPLIFTSGLFKIARFESIVLAFVGLCLISSAGYVFNDIYDIRSDAQNSEKRMRPLAAKRIGVGIAALLVIILAIIGGLMLWSLSSTAAIAGLSILALTCLYSMVLKREPILDVLVLGANFVLRASVGAFVLAVVISPWLILCTFFLSLTLSVGKRLAEVKLLGTAARQHRASLDSYTQSSALLLMGVSSTVLILSYALYSFIHGPMSLMLTLPLAFYVVMRHAFLASEGAKMARHPHLMVLDLRITTAAVLWAALTLLLLYAA